MATSFVSGMMKWTKAAEKKMEVRMNETMRVLLRDMKLKLNVSARAGKGPRGGQLWQASKKGEYPRKRTGLLQRSIQVRTDLQSAKKVTGIIFTPAEYSKYLEFDLRPFIGKLIKEKMPFIKAFWKKAL